MTTVSGTAPNFGRSFGSFHVGALLQSLDVDPLDYVNPERVEEKKREPKVAERRDFALAQIALLHEERHFHDAFGTRAGISLFMMRMKVLEEFALIGLRLRKNNERWTLPVTNDQVPLSVDMLKFIRLAFAAERAGRRFQSTPAVSQGIEGVPDPLPHVSRLQEDDLKTMIYAFPARTMTKRADGSVQPGLLHIPVAFDAILEGNAQAIQRSYIETAWGDEVAKELFLVSGITIRRTGETGHPPLYNATDLMVSRFIANDGDPTFPRSALLALSDHALAEARVSVDWGPDGNVRTTLLCPGHSFVELLGSLGAPAIRAGKVPPPADEIYASLRDQFSSLDAWESVDDNYPRPLADVKVLYNWAGRSIIAPLLAARLETNHRVFSDVQQWLERFVSLPMTPFRARPDGTLRTKDVPQRVVEAWITVVMLDSILRQLLNGDPVIFCPRAYRHLPGIDTVNLAYAGSCTEYVAGELCGRYTAGMQRAGLPDCRFADALGAAMFFDS